MRPWSAPWRRRAEAVIAYEVFAGIPADTAAAIVAALPLHEFTAGAFVAREGAVAGRLFLVESGSLAVWKGPPGTDDGVQLARAGPGDCLGEMSIVRSAPATVSIVAMSAVRLRELSLAALPDEAGIKQRVSCNLARIVAQRLRRTEASLQAAQAEQVRLTKLVAPTASYLTWNLIGLAACMFSLPLVDWLQPPPTVRAGLSVLFVAFFSAAAWDFAARNGVQRTLLGLVGRRWARQMLAGLVWSIPLVLISFALKTLGIGVLGWSRPLLEPMAVPIAFGHPTVVGWVTLAAAGVALAVAVEFLRCAVQGSLRFFFQTAGLNANFAAVVVAAILCAALEVHVGVGFAWLSLGFGLFWGSLFHRQRSFYALAASHAAVALVVSFILGFP